MKLPPKPRPWTDKDGMTHYVPDHQWEAWGRACAEAALEKAAKECDAIWERDHAAGFAGAGSSAACLKAIRNIKIEDSE